MKWSFLTKRNLKRTPLVQQRRLNAGHPIRRLGTPDDVAQAVVYLASDATGWISVVVLDVTGGAVMI